MNTNPVFSLPGANAKTEPFRRMKLAATGADYCGAEDAMIGSSLPGDLNVEQVTLQSKSVGIHDAETSAATAIVSGDKIQGAADGKITKLAAGTAIGEATESSSAAGNIIGVVYY
jgi:hypothetical protein